MNKQLLFLLLIVFTHLSQIDLLAQRSFQKIYQHGLSNQTFNILSHSDGGYAFIGIVELDAAGSEVLLTKIDCEGNTEWAKKYGISATINNVFADLVEADNGDIVFAYNIGTYQDYDIKAVRVNASTGESVWKKKIGGNRDDLAHGIRATSDGGFVICGTTNSFGTDTNGQLAFRDAYLFKLDADGEMLWSHTFGNPGEIEGAYALEEDENGQLLICGRFLVGGTFYTFLLKTDEEGNQLLFKGYGAPNHRTYGYDIHLTSDNHYLITGSTTIAKTNFQDLPDVFLLKTDESGDLVFSNIYTIDIGNDNSDSGSTIIERADGGYGIGVPTMSFTTHTQGFVPNKNAVFAVDIDGAIQKALIYNTGGSHYTRLQKDFNEGYILSMFSNHYNTDGNFYFEPLIIKTDNSFVSGCMEEDVSNELFIADLDWDVQDISATLLSGGTSVPNNPESDFLYNNIVVLCENIPDVTADFSWEGQNCVGGNLQFSDLSSDNVLDWTWLLTQSNELIAQSSNQNPGFDFNLDGDYTMKLLVTDGCKVDSIEQFISIAAPTLITGDTLICKGDEIMLGGSLQTEAGTYHDTLLTIEGCLEIIETNLELESCFCELEFPSAFTPNGDGQNDFFGPIGVDCIPEVQNYQLSIFSRWGSLVFEANSSESHWDGADAGEALPSDVYVWFTQYEQETRTGEIELIKEKGDITLIR